MDLKFFFFSKQKTASERRISDWSSDVCSSDLPLHLSAGDRKRRRLAVKSTCHIIFELIFGQVKTDEQFKAGSLQRLAHCGIGHRINYCVGIACLALACNPLLNICRQRSLAPVDIGLCRAARAGAIFTIGQMYVRSEEQTTELQ